MVLVARPKVHRRWLIAGDGGMVELWREMPMTASHGYRIRARYELHEVTTVLPKQREEDKGVPSYPDHGGLNSGEVTLMAVTAEMANVPLLRLNRLG